VLPSVSALVALMAGSVLSLVHIGPQSPLARVVFQGTPDDARALLIGIAGTVVTVIALVLGLTVVALQLSSTQFSPRLLRNFLRDRPNQVVLSIFVATFAYAAAGLYTVGVSAGGRTAEYPRLAVSVAILLLFASLGMVVYFADHLAHSIQIDAIMRSVERATMTVIDGRLGSDETPLPVPPEWAVRLAARRSGYVQTAKPEAALALAQREGVLVRLRPRVGDHVVAGTTLAWIWHPSLDDAAPNPAPFERELHAAVRIGFERTLEQDVGFGLRQLVDIACKALSPAVNDPYTAVQAVHHLSVLFCALAARPLGADVARDPAGPAAVVVPGHSFGEHLALACGLIRRYGSREPTVVVALLDMLADCAAVALDDPDRRAALYEQAGLILGDAERDVAQPADLLPIRAAAAPPQGTAERGRPSGPADLPQRQVADTHHATDRSR
jgi:uncharacterized membrane protein